MSQSAEPSRKTPRTAEAALEASIRRARLALLWEQIWPPVAAALSLILLFLALSWAGFWEVVPAAARMAGTLALVLGIGVALFPLRHLSIPARSVALARIDRASGTSHRPATALIDPLASAVEDPVTRGLWALHRERTAHAAKNLKAGPARPRLALRDPWALRFLAALMALTAFVAAGDNRVSRTLSAFDWHSASSGIPARMDAWVTPPAYTGRPPIFLTNTRTAEGEGLAAAPDGTRAHSVPQGSIVVVRTSGGIPDIDAPNARELSADEEAPATSTLPRTSLTEGVTENRFVLDKNADITAKAPGGERFAWRFTVIADAPPRIAFRAPPRLGRNGAMNVEYTIEDDYGVISAEARLTLPRKARTANTVEPRPLYGPPDVRLVLPQGRTRSGDAASTLELAEHPWAGSRVVMTLAARDEPGQEGFSEPIETTLPARTFTHPLARALIEQRRHLALNANLRSRVLGALDALALYPEKFTPQPGLYLALRSAHARLYYARTDDDLRGVVGYLWEIALGLEDGNLSGLQRDLRQAEQALREALERNAPEAEIKQLMDQLREAMGRFMQEMARRMEQQQGGQQARLPPGAQMITPDDLENMLNRMEELARGGNREAAQNLLSELGQMLRNLETARPAQMDEGSEAMARALDELGRMIREQSQLRDRTFRERSTERGNRLQRGQPQQNAEGEEGEQSEARLGELSREQGDLRQRLEEMLKELEGKGIAGNPALGDAGEEMGSAEGQLGEGDANRAFNAQGRALDALRQGAQGMAEQMMQGQGQGEGQAQSDQEGEGQGSRPGRPGQSARQEDTDPLGRPTRARRWDPGSNVRVPGEIEAQRARRVLEELRRRIGDPSRPQDEIDYLERLLRD